MSDGIHRPGIRRAGADDDVSKAAFDALAARVAALEEAGAGAGKTYRVFALTGNPSASPRFFPGARIGDKVISVSSFVLTNTPIIQDNGSATTGGSDELELTGDIFETVITQNDSILQTNNADLSAIGYLVVLERGG
jgi:hypothetical protein